MIISEKLIQKLKNEQINLSKKLNLKDKKDLNKIRLVAGIDTTFTNIWENPTTAISCIVILDIKNDFKEIEVVFAEKIINFPYIPTFLAYRELPVILEAYKSLKIRPDAFLLDGMGIIHPRKMGIAAHFGIITDEISIGIGKSKLIGEFKIPENRKFSYKPVLIEGEVRGYAVRTKKNANPIFISPGNNISVESSLKLALKCIDKYKLPEPIRKAHNYLQEYRRKKLKEG